MALPQINIHDGKHKLIVAEDGERVLTPFQNKEYEAQHPDARKEPMKAQLYDLGGVIEGIEDKLKNQTPDQKKSAVESMPGQEAPQFGTQTAPLMNQLYDKGGNVGLPSITERIQSRANDILDQQSQAQQEAEENARAINAKKQSQDAALGNPSDRAATQMKPLAPSAPVAADRIHPGAAYGNRPGEKRLDPQGNVINPTTPAGLGAIGPQRPVPTALGSKLPMYDEGGKVTPGGIKGVPEGLTEETLQPDDTKGVPSGLTEERLYPEQRPEGMGAKGPQRPAAPKELQGTPAKITFFGKKVYDEGGEVSTEQESNDPAKEAAYHQAASEVHAEEAAKHADIMNNAPLSHGSMAERQKANAPLGGRMDTEGAAPDYHLQDASMNTKNAPLSKPEMNIDNPPRFDAGDSPVQEAKTGLGPKIPAPQSTQMKNLPGIEAPLSSGATDHPMTPQQEEQAKNEASAKAAGYPVQHAAPAEVPEPDINAIIQKDKIDAAKRGHAGLADLGLAQIHENILGNKAEPTPLGPELVPGTAELPTPLKGQHPEVARRDVEMKQLHGKMLYAPTEQERFQAEKDMAELKRKTPWGSAENHPGILGKIGHVAAGLGQAALSATAPYMAEAIPGSKVNLEKAEARGEQGVEQAQKKEMATAQLATEQQKPELKVAQAEQAEQKIQNAQNALLRKQQLKVDVAGHQIPLTYEELTPQEQGAYDLQQAKSNAQNSIAELKQVQADPDSPQSKLILAKAQAEGKKLDLAGQKLGLDVAKYKADYLGLDANNNPLPGVQTTDKGEAVGVKVGKGNEATSMRLNKADLSQNVQLNAKNAIQLLNDRPDLLGKVAGRFTNVAQMAGTDDDDIVRLSIQVHNMAVASAGIHGQRGQAAVEAYEKDILNKFHNSAKSTIAGMNEISGSVQTFIDDAKMGKKVAPTPENVPTPETAKFHVKGKAGEIVSSDGKTWYDLQGKKIENKKKGE